MVFGFWRGKNINYRVTATGDKSFVKLFQDQKPKLKDRMNYIFLVKD